MSSKCVIVIGGDAVLGKFTLTIVVAMSTLVCVGLIIPESVTIIAKAITKETT